MYILRFASRNSVGQIIVNIRSLVVKNRILENTSISPLKYRNYVKDVE